MLIMDEILLKDKSLGRGGGGRVPPAVASG